LFDDFEDLATWVYFTNRYGIRKVQIFRDLLVDYAYNDPYFPIVKELKWVRTYLDEGRYLDYFGSRFDTLLREVYYMSAYGQ
jgi:hypothetical protein